MFLPRLDICTNSLKRLCSHGRLLDDRTVRLVYYVSMIQAALPSGLTLRIHSAGLPDETVRFAVEPSAIVPID
jgi:hypothetical protein